MSVSPEPEAPGGFAAFAGRLAAIGTGGVAGGSMQAWASTASRT